MAGTVQRAIGVDFGTSTSLVAEQTGRLPVEIVPLGRSTPWLPSLAGYRGPSLLVGEDADDLGPDHVIRSVKRAITENQETVSAGGRQVDPDEVIVAVLAEIAKRAATAGHPLDTGQEFRLGCPAMWTGEQRTRLVRLAEKAGMPVAGSALIDEPIAAGVAWVNDRFLRYNERPEGRLLVFDMGGGTLDIAVLDIVGGANPEISVLSAVGTSQAGDTLDTAIARTFGDELASRGFHLDDMPYPERAKAVLLREAREAKIRLSEVDRYQIVFRGMGRLPVLTYLREQLEEAFSPQMDVAERLVWAAVREAKMTEQALRRNGEAGRHSPVELRALSPVKLAWEIDYVVLVGGMSRVPYVARRIGGLFPQAQVFDSVGVPADEAIVAGLANTSDYERLNLHRPGFDFVVEWEEAGRPRQETLYAAHTPLYEGWQAWVLSSLYYEKCGRDFPAPSRGAGRLRVRSISGEYVRMRLDGKLVDGLPLRFGDQVLFRMYSDGRIIIKDGSGHSQYIRVDRWPVIRGRDFAELVLNRVPEKHSGGDDQWGYAQKDWAPPGR
ncbi:Hsp70 family protein [Sphaerisporangium aureirubrum]|uniref:Hsp70 family protein n=1 Tax=Sphaerisporangium aureirubrum TaxID=1544736 RepID=A0ABW1NLX3_9ACTN